MPADEGALYLLTKVYNMLYHFILLRRLLTISLIVISIVSTSQPVYADNAGEKLVRGIGNIFSGWLEIPLNIYEESVEETPFVGMTLGLVKGIGKTVARTCTGFYETFTFPIPFPENYESIIKPEFVFQKEI